MKFKSPQRTPKDKQTKLRKKRKGFNKWEKQFIKTYGIELYDRMRETFPELRENPPVWEIYISAAKCFGTGFYTFLLGDEEVSNGKT